MQKVYSPIQFFREFSPELLLGYLNERGHQYPDEVPIPTSDKIFEYWSKLEPDEDRKAMEEEFVHLHGFCFLPNSLPSIFHEMNFRKIHPKDFPGFNAGTFNDKLESFPFPEDKFLWVMTHHRDIFLKAAMLSTADQLAARRYFHKRPTGYFQKPRDDEAVKNELGESISLFFQAKGKGRIHNTDILDRNGVIYYFIYLEDIPKSGGEFKNGTYKKTVIRTTFDVVFWFDPQSGELSTYAPGGRDVREDMERRFAEICLGNPDLPPLPKKPVYNIEMFKNPELRLDMLPTEGFEYAQVKSLKLLPHDSGYEIVFNAASKDADVRQHLRQYQFAKDGGTVPLIEFKVANVEIELFKRKDGPASEKLKIRMHYPNGCDLGAGADHKRAGAWLVRLGIQEGGPPEIIRQIMAAYEQDVAIGYLHFHEWPDDALTGLLEQKIIKEVAALTSINCNGCEGHPLCPVQTRLENGKHSAFIVCSMCGVTRVSEDEIRQYRVNADGMGAFILRQLEMSAGTINKHDRFWDLGPLSVVEGGGRAFLLHGPVNTSGGNFPKSLESETGICFGLSLSYEPPPSLPEGLMYVPLRREILIDGKRVYLDTAHLLEVYQRFLEKKRPQVMDMFGNARPPKMLISGNAAITDKKLVRIWREYLDKYSPEVKVYLFQLETHTLDWTQAMRARFIFSGSNPPSQYQNNLKKILKGPLSGAPIPEGGWFKKPYKRRVKREIPKP